MYHCHYSHIWLLCASLTNSLTHLHRYSYCLVRMLGVLERGGLILGCDWGTDVHMNDMPLYVHSDSAKRRLEAYIPACGGHSRGVVIAGKSTQRPPPSTMSSNGSSKDGPVHVVVLQHGFQGSSHDMKIMRNALFVEFPTSLVGI